MALKLYNTMSRRKEAFAPADDKHVRMYVCGPTVYDLAHVGNARPVVVFDVLYRLLKHHYPKVTYARNITDVDDKIIDAAKDGGEAIDALTARTTQAFHDDMAELGTLEPDVEPRATDHIPEMIALIETLIAKGHAYEGEGHVLFDVPSMEDYGRLSRRQRDAQIAGARVEVAPYKKDPTDFVLWKPSTPDQPGWDSPWGRGRPGWHLECSAMSEKHLGPLPFDIHGGGQDLIFPHHENEIAQSRCAHDGGEFAKYWVHNGYLVVEGEKMAKSLGNFFTVRDLLAEFPGEAIRLALLKTHYRKPLDFTRHGLREAKADLDYMYEALGKVSGADGGTGDIDGTVVEALDDDLNTPLAISGLHRRTAILNRMIDSRAKDAELAETAGDLLATADLLGLLKETPDAWFKWRPAGAADIEEAEIEDLLARREAARAAKDFAAADSIRDELAAKGIVLEDGAGGTKWKRAG